ncbi:Os12g0531000 [Oryza sativa Japonica Group]|uniref:Os12g0531000 protein n=1 Tax=Oryza sativa subsp. japonica TaxID=39947 RepID=A0A0P0YAW9_ORYSJ|nr:Os12g0531000 [Oryza sativa Japonica Group]
MLLLSDCVCAIVLSKTKSNSKPKRSNNHGVGLDNEEPEAAQPTTMEENTMAAPVIARRGAQMCCHHNTVTAKGEWEKALEVVWLRRHQELSFHRVIILIAIVVESDVWSRVRSLLA